MDKHLFFLIDASLCQMDSVGDLLRKSLVFLFLLLPFVLPPVIYGQISFYNDPSTSVLTTDFRSGVAIGIADLNGNFRDDLLRQDNSRFLHVDFQAEPGRYLKVLDGQRISGPAQWNIVSADLTGNGLFDIVSAGFYDGVFIFRQVEPGVFQKTELDEDIFIYAQTANAIDINNDGHIDLFICNDRGISLILGNDGEGNFRLEPDWIDLATVPASDNSGNYGSVWSDVSGNGKMDLYISKCHSDAREPTDPRRINQLFVNLGNGEFVESAADFGIANGAQSWASDFGDINNNGLMDLVMINHPNEVVLYINRGDGTFEDISVEAGLEEALSGIQVQFADFDNDGFLDILISGLRHYLYRNNGDNTFSLMENPFSANSISSFSIGDLNDDGFLDIYASHTVLYNSPPGPIDDAIWYNQGNDNHWLRLKLVGTESNRDGIGAIVRAYSELGIQSREVRAGESFGIQRSNLLHFGMGEVQVLDSLEVIWPSGQKDVFYDLKTSQKYLITEGVCISPVFELQVVGDLKRCSGESVTLRGPGADVYFWSSGQSSREITTNESGILHLRTQDAFGCNSISEPVFLEDMSDFSLDLSVSGDLLICSGDGMEVYSLSPWEINWSDGHTGSWIEVDNAGIYFANTGSLSCGTFYSDTLFLEVLEIAPPVYSGELYFESSPVMLMAEGENIQWFFEMDDELTAHTGNQWQLDMPPGEFEFFFSRFEIVEGSVMFVGESAFSGTSLYPAPHINGGLVFDAFEPFTLASLKMYSEFDGPRVIKVLDRNENLITTDTVHLEDAAQGRRVSTQLDIPTGKQHIITTCREFNQQVFGVSGPRLYRSNRDTNFPYRAGEVVEIQSTTFGAQYYYFFYDWEIKLPDLVCESERIPVKITVDTGSSVEEDFRRSENLKIYPNPATGQVNVYWNNPCNEACSILIRDITGREIHREVVRDITETFALDISFLPPGLYHLEFVACGVNHSGKLVVGK